MPAHLPGDVHVGLYPLLKGDLCLTGGRLRRLSTAMLDALA
ncbi:MAG TPA: hypothetical protein VE196_06010 [Pseudonocardiaceae bacterium]|nr:hypothetical protein [Pseudonocardiaceae bacterium]